ncbi:hypothetical protein GCM10009678_58560 [Actinomadura kijaniata]|uniref:Ca2+-binding EF-hand superfamily protein n=1 Tax=Actinomadura namibiensis TaxID=182080 RepID=A0A7W3QLD2_ACTNM|nr:MULTISPECIES: EF-hand domain-containing protein [Actinomadura]MBA8950863.1 Ca2+-binding EF-hand superfamily protein [Actinomadura namibiensis]
MAKLDDTARAELRQAFDDFDADSDGTVSFDEMRRAVAALGMNAPEDLLRELFAEADTDGDGRLDFEEYLGLFGGLPAS